MDINSAEYQHMIAVENYLHDTQLKTEEIALHLAETNKLLRELIKSIDGMAWSE